MATTYRLPTISTVSTLSTVERATILDHLFEPSIPLHTLSVELLRSQSFSSYDDLIASIGIQLTELLDSPSTSDADWLVKILGAHPRLGEKKVDSAQSKAEQARLNSENESETEELRKLNDEYEQRFLGLRYVVFVNGRSRPVIMVDMHKRIERGDIKAEKAEAIKAMCEIAADRSKKLTSA